MFYDIFRFLLDIAAGLVAGACLLRAYMHRQRMPLNVANTGPLGQFVQAITDWIVLPLRRVFKPSANLDAASVLAAFLILLAQHVLLFVLGGAGVMGLLASGLVAVPVAALFALARLVVSMVTGLLIVYAIMSWVQPGSWMMMTLHRLVEPLLAPLRRIIPTVGGVDLSVLAAIVLLQVVGMMLAHLQMSVFGSLLA